ncbi:MAG TPA: glycosyltransferase [Chryseolinea sp.]|nr:glycosyltransferase [Chryseolinea sp.]
MPLFFSIIIPTYNRASTIRSTLDSVFKHAIADMEVIVVDDGSDDNTQQVVAEIVDIRLRYVRKNNGERAAARNFGYGMSKGRYVNFFDSDDLFVVSLEDLRRRICELEYPPVVFGDIGNVTAGGLHVEIEPRLYDSFTRNLLHNNFLACGSVFLDRNILSGCLFNENRMLTTAEDWELWLRIHAKHPFTYIPVEIFRQVHHSRRSLNTISPERIEDRDNLLVRLVMEDNIIVNFYGSSQIRLFISDRCTFIALNWCGVDNNRAFYYWRRAIFTSLKVVSRKRFWAVAKKMIVG